MAKLSIPGGECTNKASSAKSSSPRILSYMLNYQTCIVFKLSVTRYFFSTGVN